MEFSPNTLFSGMTANGFPTHWPNAESRLMASRDQGVPELAEAGGPKAVPMDQLDRVGTGARV